MPPVRFVSRALTIIAVVSAGALLAGCEASVSTGGDTTNGGDAADVLSKQYVQQVGLKLTEINCDDADAKVGATFTCEGTNESDVKLTFDAKVTSIDKDAQKVGFSWEVSSAVAKGTAFSGIAATTLQNQGSAVSSIECPDEIRVQINEVVECTATMDDGSQRDVTLTLTDNDGGFDIKLK